MNLLSGAEIYCPLSVLQRGFFEKIQENFVGTLDTVRNTGNREVSVPRGLTVQLIETYQCAIFLNALFIKPNRRKMNEMYKRRKRLNDNRCNNNNNNNNNNNKNNSNSSLKSYKNLIKTTHKTSVKYS